jgi:FkbM family methyltransferase
MISKNYVPKVVFDIGGHIGTFTKLMHTYFPDAIYICVEPNTRSFDLLRRNVPFAWCFNGACTYDEVSVLTDDKYEATGGGFMTTQEKFATDELNHKDNFIYKIGEENVESITIEQILQIVGVSSIDVLKLDCEGSEFSIMTGMPKEVAAGVTLCVGEYHTDQGPDYFKEVAKKTFPQLEFEVGGRTPIDHFHSTLAIAP